MIGTYNKFSASEDVDVLILFRGGTSGNFLQYLIQNKIRGVSTPECVTDRNEYLPTASMSGSGIVATHINFLYGVHHTIETVAHLPSSSIIQMLNKYVKNVVHVVNKTDPQWSAFLGGIKHGVEDVNILSRRGFREQWHRTQWSFSEQYQWFYDEILLRQYIGNLFYLDYEDFFVNGNTDPLCDFLGSSNYLEVNQTVKKYHNENVQLMHNAGWEWDSHA